MITINASFSLSGNHVIYINLDRTVEANIIKWNGKNILNYTWDEVKRINYFDYKETSTQLIYLMVWIFEKKDGIIPRKIKQFRILIDKPIIEFKNTLLELTLTINEQLFKLGTMKKYDKKEFYINTAKKILKQNMVNVTTKLRTKTDNYHEGLFYSIDETFSSRNSSLLSSLLISDNEFVKRDKLKEMFLNITNYLLKFYKDIDIEFDPRINWVDVISWIATRVYNYIADKGNGDYVPLNGDCIPLGEQIYTINGLTKVGNLEVGTMVLSYDFQNKCFVYKPITKIWDKGKKKIYKVMFRNGTNVHVTKNHPFWSKMSIKDNQGNSRYRKRKLSDINLNNYQKQIPFIKRLPYNVVDIKWLTEDHCFIIGFFMGDGCNTKYEAIIGSHKVPDMIEPRLSKLGIPFSTYKTNYGVPCVRILKSDFKRYLRGLKNNSFDMKLYPELMNLPIHKLKIILEGHFEADGHYHKTSKTIEKIYSTSCEFFANQLYKISLKIGESLYKYKQVNHQGLGNSPIFRMHNNPNSFFKRDYGYRDLSELAIKEIVDTGRIMKTIDFEVEDTNLFIFKNGVVGHNCEDLKLKILYDGAAFNSVDFQSNVSKEETLCLKMKYYYNEYIKNFTLCSTKSYKYGAKTNEKSYHVFGIALSKPKLGLKTHCKEKLPNLIIEATNIVYPKYEVQNNKLTNNKLTNNYNHHDLISDKLNIDEKDLGIRYLRFSKNSTFYDDILQLYTSELIEQNGILGYNVFNRSKNTYGLNNKLFFGNKNIKLITQPEITKDFKFLSVYDSRFKFPPIIGKKVFSFCKKPKLPNLEMFNYKPSKEETPVFCGWLSRQDLLYKSIMERLEQLKEKYDIEIQKQHLFKDDNDYVTYYCRFF